MEIKKWSKFCFFLFPLFFNCRGNVDDRKFDEKKTTIDTVILSEPIVVNDAQYNRTVLLPDSLDFQKICWNAYSSENSISYVQDELFIKDSIIDINEDGFDDLCIDYQSDIGIVKLAYIFDQEKNEWLDSSLIFHNYLNINDTSFFEVFPLYHICEFRKSVWEENHSSLSDKIFVDISVGIEKRSYFQVMSEDTIDLTENDLKQEDVKVIDTYFKEKFNLNY